jgi:putative intracellular protease/amidase
LAITRRDFLSRKGFTILSNMESDPIRALALVDRRYGANWNIEEGLPSIAREFADMGWKVDLASALPLVEPCAWAEGRGLPALEPGLRIGAIGEVSAWDVLVILPGQAHEALLADPAVLELVRKAEAAGLAIASFCRGARVLARAGVLEGRHMTGHADYEAEYLAAGAIYHGYHDRAGKSDAPPPIVDGNLVTSMRSNYFRGQACEAIRIAAENARAARKGRGVAAMEAAGAATASSLARPVISLAEARAGRLVFAFPLIAGEEGSAYALVKSLRSFGASLAESRILAMVGSGLSTLAPASPAGAHRAAAPLEAVLAELAALGVEIAHYEIPDQVVDLPLAGFPAAAATAEAFVADKPGGEGSVLVWAAPDTLFLREPLELLLPAGTALAFRPVHHALIGWKADAGPDDYWKAIYEACGVSLDAAFPVLSTMDREVLHFYPNAGFLAARPEAGILRRWGENFAAHAPRCAPQAGTDPLVRRRRIFAHQAFLAASILSALPRSAIRELSFGYNYPLHLHGDCPSRLAAKALEDLTTVRYDDWKAFPGGGSEAGIAFPPVGEELRAWLAGTFAEGSRLAFRRE